MALSALPSDLLHAIGEYLATDPHSLGSFSLTNKYIAASLESMLKLERFRIVSDIRPFTIPNLMISMAEQYSVLQCIRTLH